MQERAVSFILAAAFTVLAGCHSTSPAATVGDRLPVVSSKSVALPGAVNSADAPKAPAVVEPRTDNLVEYRDAAHGVSFGYPSRWRPAQPGSSYLEQPDFAQVAPKPLITQVFSAEGNAYEGTVLDSLSFSYTVQQHTTAAACAAVPAKALKASLGSHPATYNGRQYTESQGRDTGACHQLSATVDSTLQRSNCYIFERDMMTTCPYTKTKTEPRPLTAAETSELQHHLDAVMGSVQIAAPGS